MDQTTRGDSVQEQLREELLARVWAVHPVSPRGLADVFARDYVARVDEASARWSSMLRDPSPTARRKAASTLQRTLWPTFRPAEEWWTTPLGELLSTTLSKPACPSIPPDGGAGHMSSSICSPRDATPAEQEPQRLERGSHRRAAVHSASAVTPAS